MTDFLKMDVFFVVATVVTVLVGVLVAVALFYLVRILRTVDRIGEDVAEETSAIRADIGEARARIKQEGFRIASFASLFGKLGKIGHRARTRKKRDET